MSSKILFALDHARLHVASRNQDVLNAFKWEVFPHPPYSLDLSESNLQLYQKIKHSAPLIQKVYCFWLKNNLITDQISQLVGFLIAAPISKAYCDKMRSNPKYRITR